MTGRHQNIAHALHVKKQKTHSVQYDVSFFTIFDLKHVWGRVC